jgi:hypothetical protein
MDCRPQNACEKSVFRALDNRKKLNTERGSSRRLRLFEMGAAFRGDLLRND